VLNICRKHQPSVLVVEPLVKLSKPANGIA
jgi:hypothetical protein